MELKRNQVGQFPQSTTKHTTLIQPFINISKASTPVRTRVIPPGSQINNTPVNLNKIVGQPHKSPNNKQNFHNNQHRNDLYGKGDLSSKPRGDHESRVNLSPILALNRKLNEGPKYYAKKSLTPENHKVISDYEGFGQADKKIEKNYTSNSSLNQSKGSSNSNFNSTANLRGSNCFKALIENRCKSPNQFESSNGKVMQKRESTPLLKESMSSNQLFRNAGHESRSKLTESRSFEQLRGVGGGRLQGSEIKCMNNDGKKAKYKVLNSDDETFNVQNGQLYFCSKCTIPLVQQGFIVEEIGKQTNFFLSNQSSEVARYSDYKTKLEAKRKNIECQLIQIAERQEEQIGQLQEYYENIFAFLERQRVMDRQKIEKYYKDKKQQPTAFVKDLNASVESLEEAIRNPFQKHIRVDEVEQLINYDMSGINVGQLGIFCQNIDDLTARFSQIYDLNLKINFTPFNRSTPMEQNKGLDIIGNRNHAMRFSFEKLLGGTGTVTNKKINQDVIDPLIEVDEEEYCQNQGIEPQKQEHQAFRDLFPQQEEGTRLNTDIYSPTFKNI